MHVCLRRPRVRSLMPTCDTIQHRASLEASAPTAGEHTLLSVHAPDAKTLEQWVDVQVPCLLCAEGTHGVQQP